MNELINELKRKNELINSIDTIAYNFIIEKKGLNDLEKLALFHEKRKVIFEDYLTFVSSYYSPETYRYYESHLRCFLNYFEDKLLTQVNLLNYVTNCKNKGISNKTINKRILAAKRAYEYSNIYCDPLENYIKLKEEDRRFDVLSKDQIQIFKSYLSECEISLENQVILRVLFDTGIRLSELIRIRILDYNPQERSIKLRNTKTHKDRVVFVRKSTAHYIFELIRDRVKENHDYLDEYTKLITMSKSGITSLFYRIKKELGFHSFHPHMLRHTYATWLIRNNTPIELVRKIMGHSNYEMTKRYIHQNDEDVQNMLKLIDKDF